MRFVYFTRGEAHRRLAETSIASVQKLYPNAWIQMYADDDPGYCPMPQGMPIMLANLEAQVRAIVQVPKDELVCFLDTDVILLQRFRLLETFDLAVTWRDHVLLDEDGQPIKGIASIMPYNYGVLLARGGLGAIEAFIWMRERIRRMTDQLQQWYGNQVALAALCGPAPGSGTLEEMRAIPWTPTTRGNYISVAKLPCDIYNYTPQHPGEDTSGRVALHFKGKKRGLMRQYAEALGLPWTVTENQEAA